MSGRLGLRKKKKERGKTGENHDKEGVKQPVGAFVEGVWMDQVHQEVVLAAFVCAGCSQEWEDDLVRQKYEEEAFSCRVAAKG